MKVYSWNVCCANKTPEKVAAFVKGIEFDVLCLQEVTKEMLAELKTLEYHVAVSIDRTRLLGGGRTADEYLVILSRYPLSNIRTVVFKPLGFPLRTLLYIGFMSAWGWSKLANRTALLADVTVDGKSLRACSVHITLWGPHSRATEFKTLMEFETQQLPSIIAGDFNIVEWGPMKILGWLLGAPLYMGMPWYPERALFEERFSAWNLKNPLQGKVTHDFSRSQLDHILVSENLPVLHSEVVSHTYGSDHHPVMLEVTV